MSVILTREGEQCLVRCTRDGYLEAYRAKHSDLSVGSTATFTPGSRYWDTILREGECYIFTEWWIGDVPYCASLNRDGNWTYWRQDAKKVKAWMERKKEENE